MGLLELPAQCLQLAHIAWLVLCWTAEKGAERLHYGARISPCRVAERVVEQQSACTWGLAQHPIGKLRMGTARARSGPSFQLSACSNIWLETSRACVPDC